MPEKRNALAELADRFAKGTITVKDIDAAGRIVAELAKNNTGLIPQECYGCGVLKSLARCRAIAEEGAGDGKL